MSCVQIESCNPDGSDCETHSDGYTSTAYPYGIGVFTYQMKGYIYAGDRSSILSRALVRVPVSRKDGGTTKLLKMSFPKLSQPNSLAVKRVQQAIGIN